MTTTKILDLASCIFETELLEREREGDTAKAY
ncbi:MAG: hypothetical protein ACI8RD_001034 [Bacillariaceae sp.]|jgi:hypothetical protein